MKPAKSAFSIVVSDVYGFSAEVGDEADSA